MRFGGLIAAIVFAAVAAVIVLRMMGGQQAPAPVAAPAAQEVKTASIFVAAQAIPIGTTVTQEMLAIQPWPENLLLDSFSRADKGANEVVGKVARSPFQAQEPIILSKLANRNDPNFLAGALPKGMRVISIKTNETEGVSGFVFPGDRVDVLYTHEVSKLTEDEGRSKKETVSETLLSNVKVLAVDQRAGGANPTDSNGKLLIPHSVSLMVSPTDAQRVRLADRMGTLTLVLRSIEDKDSEDQLSVTHPNDISQYKDAVSGLGGEDSAVLIRRGAPKENKESTEDSAPRVTSPATTPVDAAILNSIQRRGY